MHTVNNTQTELAYEVQLPLPVRLSAHPFSFLDDVSLGKTPGRFHLISKTARSALALRAQPCYNVSTQATRYSEADNTHNSNGAL